MTATLHADLVKEAREVFIPVNTNGIIGRLCAAIESLERQLAAAEAVIVEDANLPDDDPLLDAPDLPGWNYVDAKLAAVARHRERMK